ncbi:winged helix-turn-helix transcriptional regulator [Actinomadura parmotrematis]|uniref:Helix-turn-helix transcriptional regulator n=1 Tax=Actinomadura parmotrematis TaxID=2864039 RepID=A0ABS7FUM2_9ACTN|nr:helix-turn-helix domain-containing protein [Actinomadura parmotrematis]MBW8484098.1 helix-turn-helix transcriptional regulator [Actinomadura parmotrematis]
MGEPDGARTGDAGACHEPAAVRGREILARIGDKWSLEVIALLGDRPHRFSELRRGIDGISQRMLTVTLRGLERDGIVDRTVTPVTPPRVDYALTDLGRTLLCNVVSLFGWVEDHLGEIDKARLEFDLRDAEARALREA